MSNKKRYNTNSLKRESLIKYLRIFLIAMLAVIVFYPPYLQGLYFEKHVLPTQIIVFITFIVLLIYKWLKDDFIFFRTPIDYISLGFVVIYFLSIFVAVHTRSAIIEWLKYYMYFAVFYMISDLADNQKTKLLFLWTIVISATGVSIIGLDAAMGGNLVRILNKFFNILGVKNELFFGLFVGNRIHSTLQYPNALASFLMAVFFVAVGLLMFYDKWWQKIILASFSFILFSTFMLTQSRGAQLFFPIAVIILFFSAPRYNRIKALTHIVLLAIPAGMISLYINSYLSSEKLNEKAILFLVIGLLVTIFFSLFLRFISELIQKINWKLLASLISVFVLVSVICLYYAINSSVPLELTQEINSNSWKQISRQVVVKPNNEYLLRYKVDATMDSQQPYSLYIRIYSQSENGILSGEKTLLNNEIVKETNGMEEKIVKIKTLEDSKFVYIDFINYYAGTRVIVDDVCIVDAYSGETIEKIMLKNKYNLENVIYRFRNIWMQPSLLTRIIFYRDGFKIFKDKWFLGAGGGAWSYIYKQYQSYNYNSNQAHNYPLQIGIETGILGILVLLSLIVFNIIIYIRYYKKTNSNIITAFVITAIAALFMHSIIDFDFAESSMLLLFWVLIALFNHELLDSFYFGELRLFNLKKDCKIQKYTAGDRNKNALVVSVIIISIVTLYFSSAFYLASLYAKDSFKNLQQNNIEKAINAIEKAIKLDKFNEKYVLGYNPISNRPDIKTGMVDILFIKNDLYKKAQERGDEISDHDLYLFQKQFSRAVSYIENIENKANNNLSLASD